MSVVKKTWILLICFMVISITFSRGYAQEQLETYPEYSTSKVTLGDTYTLIKETSDIKLFYKKHNGIFKIEDKNSNYVWTSGIDHDYDQYIENNVELFIESNPLATPAEIALVASPLEEQMNNSREGIANSFIVVDMMRKEDPARASTQMGSSFKTFTKKLNPDDTYSVSEVIKDSVDTNNLYRVNDSDSHFLLDIQFKAFDVRIKAHILVHDTGFEVEIRDHEITGEDSNYINYINIMPFLGAYGGKQKAYNELTGKWDIDQLKPRHDGYAFVPDGPGALIEFKQYNSGLSGYTGLVYGNDMAQYNSNMQFSNANVPTKNPLMPVFGIAYGAQDAAFVSYATKGAEYMEIISRPNDSSDAYNLTNYTITFSRFLYNNRYSQVFNQAGETYISAFEDRNHYDVSLKYDFMSEEPSYVGMAKTYRDYLFETNQIELKPLTTAIDIPIRIDFLMSDVKKSLIGNEEVVVTTIHDVEDILNELSSKGISNINSGLYGYQKGGLTLGNKGKPTFIRDIGSADAFDDVVTSLNQLGIDVSLSQNFTEISEASVNLTNTANKHLNGRYMMWIDPMNTVGVTNHFYYTRPVKVTEFVKSQEKTIRKLGFESITYDGYTNQLYTDYTKKRDMLDAVKRYQEVQDFIRQNYVINNVTPNQYMWANTDRFLQTPMFSSQYIVETKTVPFLQLVLSGTMALYTTYVNFSFYEQKDILKMVDYNTYPAFVITKEPAYKLQKTNAQNFFSTEYQINDELIEMVYNKVNHALNSVMNATWLNRIEIQPNVFENTYSNGVKIIINYQTNSTVYEGKTIEPQNYIVIGG